MGIWKSNTCKTVAIAATILFSGIAQAELYYRGEGLIYDSGQDITWLQDANYAKTSGYDPDGRMDRLEAQAWIASLNSANHLGYDDWRLPKASQPDITCQLQISVPGYPDQGYGAGCTASEMGRLQNLNGVWPNTPKMFINLQPDLTQLYRSETPFPGNPTEDFNYKFDQGIQGIGGIYHYAWAVRDGDSLGPTMIYWAEEGSGKIRRRALDGGVIEDLVTTGLHYPRGLAIHLAAGKMYWADNGTNKIEWANLDGSDRETLFSDQPNPSGLALDLIDNKLYWGNWWSPNLGIPASTFPAIRRSSLDGTTPPEDVCPGDYTGHSLSIDPIAKVAYMAGQGTDIYTKNLIDCTSQALTIGSDGDNFPKIDLAARKVYWTYARAADAIYRTDLDGPLPVTHAEAELLIYEPDGNNSYGIGSLALDLANGKMYWAQSMTGKIRRANLDGSDPEDVISGLATPTTIALTRGSVMFPVTVDIAPWSTNNIIHPNSDNTIVAAVMGSSLPAADTGGINASAVESTMHIDEASVRLGIGEAKNIAISSLSGDFDGDGLTDSAFAFSTQDTGIACNDTEVTLTGETTSGVPISGTDTIDATDCITGSCH